MPDGSVPLLIAIIVLILLSGFFSATETSYSCVNKIKLKSMINNGNNRAKQVLELSEKYETLLTTILIGNNIVNLSAAAISGVFFAKIITGGVDSSVVSTIVLTVLVLIFGEITPKLIAKSYPEKVAMLFYPMIMFFYYILYPLNLIFRGYQKLLSIMFKIKPDDTITDEQLLTIVDEAEEDGVLKEDESELVRSAIEFRDSEAGDILVPRVKIVAVPFDATMEQIHSTFTNSGFSRLIVYKESIDDVLGFVHEKDFYNAYLNGQSDIGGILNKTVVISQHTKISELLKMLQKQKCQIATVFDEYGGLLGIVTVEDILEELVGEIWDEHDEEELPIRKVSDDEYVVCGNCEIDEIFSLLDISEKEEEEIESNTIGGFLTELVEKIPEVGEVVDWNGLHIEVLKATDKQVLEVKITVLEKDEEEEADKKFSDSIKKNQSEQNKKSTVNAD